MGCGQSKLGNEDTVRRCKDRRRLIKEAVYARHHLAAVHSDYCRSLRLTGSALIRFAGGEPLAVSDHTPAVLPHKPPNVPSSSIHPPPPPAPLSATSSHHQPNRRKKPIKLPHILSDSSLTSSPPPIPNYTYSNTPSQVSSVWNWDNFCAPPSPPNSEFFDQLHSHDDTKPPYQDDEFRNPFSSDQASYCSSYSDIKNPTSQHTAMAHKKGQSSSEEEAETEREEVQCSEWGDHDHYSTTSTSSNEDQTGDHRTRSDFQTDEATNKASGISRSTNMNANSNFSSKSDKPNLENDDGNQGRVNSDMRLMVRHKDFAEIVAAINEYFVKAASSGEQVSEILMGRAQLDRSFKQLKSLY